MKRLRKTDRITCLASDARNGTPHLTAGAVARALGVSPRTITVWCDVHGLPHYRIPAKHGAPLHRRIPRAQLVAWLEKQGVPVPPVLRPATGLLVSDAVDVVPPTPYTRVACLMHAGFLLAEWVFGWVAFDLYTVDGWAVLGAVRWLRTHRKHLPVFVVELTDTMTASASALTELGVTLVERRTVAEVLACPHGN